MANLTPLTAIVVGVLLMSAIALVGTVTPFLRGKALDGIIRPLVVFAAGSLLGGLVDHAKLMSWLEWAGA